MKKKLTLSLGLALAAAAFLISDPAGWNLTRFIQPEYWERHSTELAALYEIRTVDGQEVFVPVPAEKAAESLAAGTAPRQKAVRAQLLEQLGRLDEAAQAWRDTIAASKDPAEGITALAAFHHRHRQFRQEMELLEKSVAPLTSGEHPALTPAEVWDRIVALSADAGLDPAARSELERRRIAGFQGKPEQEQYFRAWLDSLLADKRWPEFDAGLAEYARQFPGRGDTVVLLECRRLVARGEGGRLPAFFAGKFHPLMDPETLRWVFGRMEEQKQWKAFVGEAERRLRANPLDRDAVGRLYQAQFYKENLSAAAGLLKDYRLLKNARLGRDAAVPPWQPEELAVMGVLAAHAGDPEEALRYFHSFYRDARPGEKFAVPGLSAALVREEALKSAFWLMAAGDEGVQRYHRESLDGLGTLVSLDTDPGLPLAILSVILNGRTPADELSALESGAGPYFVARRAEAIVTELKAYLPPAEYLQYRARLAPLYEAHGDRQGAVRLLEELGGQPADADLQRGFLLEAARYAEADKDTAATERLLRRAAAVEAQGAAAPLSAPALLYWQPDAGGPRRNRWQALDALAEFLKRQDRPLDVVSLFNGLIQKNPRQEELYEKLAAFLESTDMTSEQARLYQRAIQEFDQPGWFNRLARYYLKQKLATEFQDLSRKLAARFGGSDLEAYVTGVLPEGQGLLGDKPYRRFALEIHQAALDRFPLNQRFLNQVLELSRRLDPPRRQRLLAAYAMVSDSVRDLYFQDLSARGLLQPLLAADPPADDPLRVYLAAEARVWRCRYEQATPLYEKLAAMYPGDAGLVGRCALLLQSEGAFRPERYGQAAELLTTFGERNGQEADYLTQAGDCLALGGDLPAAAKLWRRILDLYPRDPEKWKEVATVFWDYYLFDDSLNLLQEARKRANDPDLYPFEVGALEEEAGRTDAAMAEYLKIAVTWDERHWEARSRLDTLLKKDANRAVFERVVGEQLKSRPKPVDFLVGVREFLGDWNRAAQFPLDKWAGAVLAGAADADTVRDALSRLDTLLTPDERLAGYRRLVELAPPGVERLEAVFTLAGKLRDEGRGAEALALVGGAVKENPLNLGVIRRSVAEYRAADRRDLAAAALRGALPAAVAPYKLELTNTLLDVLTADKKFADAAAVAAAWVADNPKDLVMMDRQWSALSSQGQHAAVIQACQAALAKLPSLEPDPDQRKAKAAQIRHRIILAALALGDSTQALDQYIELLKTDPENEGQLERAFMLASRSGKLDRLTAYCDKTAAASTSDYRWPLLRARLAMLEEDPAAAVEQYARCLKIVPQRTDLVAESARPMEILGDWAGLQKLYADLSKQQYNAPEWLRQAATAAWRGGRDAEARDLLRRYAEATGGSPTAQALAQYDAFVDIHHEDWAVETVLKLLQPDAPAVSLLDELRYRGVLAAARRAGRLPDVLGRLLALFDAAIADEDADRIGALSSLLGNNLEQVFGEPLPAEEREAAVRAILARLPGWLDGTQAEPVRDAFLPAAKKGAVSELLEPLYGRRMAGWTSSYMPWDVKEYLSDRAMWPVLAGLYRRVAANPNIDSDTRRAMQKNLAWLAMIQSQPAEELQILKGLYAGDEVDIEAARRYFELLSRENRLADLGANFEGVRAYPEDFVEFLAGKGDFSRAAAGIGTLFPAREPVWREANLALLGEASGGAVPMDAPFRSVLRLVPVGKLLRTDADSSVHLLPPAWQSYATRYGVDLLAKSGGSGPELSLAAVERNHRRRQEYEELFERLLAAGLLSRAKEAAVAMKTMEARPVADAWARLRLAAAGTDAAETEAAYRALLETLTKGDDFGFVTEHGTALLALGRKQSLLPATAPEWGNLFTRYRVVETDNALAETWRVYTYALPAAARAKWLKDYLAGQTEPEKGLAFYADQGVFNADNFLPLVESVAGQMTELDAAGREVRLILLGKRWGAVPPPPGGPREAQPAVEEGYSGRDAGGNEDGGEYGEYAPPAGGVLLGGPLRDTLGGLDSAGWQLWKAWLEQQAGKPAKPAPAEILAWAAGLPDGASVWAERQAQLYDAWGLAAEARALRKAQLESELAERLPTPEESYQLGAWEAEGGDPDVMIGRFSTALNRADDRLAMARRIVEFLNSHGQPRLAEPFLVTLEALDRNGPLPAELRLRRLLETDLKLVGPERVLAFLDRPDVPLDRKTDVIAKVVDKGLQDRAWAGAIAKALADASGRPWAEARRLLAVRLQSLLSGPEAALPVAVADLGAHPDARLLAGWVVERAEKARQPEVAGRYLPVILRGRAADAPLTPLLPAALAGGLEKTFLSMIWSEALAYNYLNDRSDPYYLNSVGNQVRDRLERDQARLSDLAAAEQLLGRLNLRGGLAEVWGGALAWRVSDADKEGLAGKVLDLQPELERQRREAGARFQMDRNVGE